MADECEPRTDALNDAAENTERRDAIREAVHAAGLAHKPVLLTTIEKLMENDDLDYETFRDELLYAHTQHTTPPHDSTAYIRVLLQC